MNSSLEPAVAALYTVEQRRELVLALQAKQQIATQVWQAMQTQRITKTEMARRMGTTRRVLDRLLDADNASVTLLTLSSAARVLGQRMNFELVAQAASVAHRLDVA